MLRDLALLSKFFRRSEPKSDEAIIEAYGKLLSDKSMVIRDVGELYHSKGQIKCALLDAIKQSSNVSHRKQLHLAYLFLADFQTLKPEEVRALRSEEVATSFGAGLSTADRSMLVVDNYEIVAKVRERVEKERAALVNELQRLDP